MFSDEADELMGQVISYMREVADADVISLIEERHNLLRRCREVGIEQALAEQTGGDLRTQNPYTAFSDMQTPEVKAVMRELATSGSAIVTPEDLQRRLAERPDLHAKLEAALQLEEAGSEAPPEFGEVLRQAHENLDQYQASNDLAALDAAILSWRHILAHPAFPSMPEPFQISVFQDASGCFMEYYEAVGQKEILDQVLHILDDLVRRLPTDSPKLPDILDNLGGALRTRYSRIGRLEDLDQAIQLRQRALQLIPTDSPHPPIELFNNLAHSLQDRYGRTKRPEDLEQAIEFYQKALQFTSVTSSDKATSVLSGLAGSLHDRYYQSHKERTEDLDQAIEFYQKALHLTPTGSPDMPSRLTHLAHGLRTRYERTWRMEDLDQTIHCYRTALLLTATDSPSLPSLFLALAHALQERHERIGRPRDLQEAVMYYERACQKGVQTGFTTALGAARTWGGWAVERGDYTEAARAYTYGIQAAERIYDSQLLRKSQEVRLGEIQGLHAQTAYVLAQIGQLREAVVTLELGRARNLSEGLARDRFQLEQIRLEDLGAYDRYQLAARRMRHLVQIERESKLAGLNQQVIETKIPSSEQILQAREELEQAIANIRQIHGHEEFLAAPTFSHIQAAIQSTPLVYIIAAGIGGLALIVYPDAACTITPLWLPDLTEEALLKTLLGTKDSPQSYMHAYAAWRDNPNNVSARNSWFETLDKTTQWLWQVLMGPLIETLNSASSAIIIPYGYLGLLPLHAAWEEDPTMSAKRRYALDSIEITYVPNARILVAVRKIASQTTSDVLLAISDPQPVRANPLPNSDCEVLVAASTFPRCRIFKREKATREAVLNALPNYPVLHFSCHGYINPKEPLASGLVMANGELLMLHDLLNLHLLGARLAVLSACETGFLDVTLPDEVMSLSAGLLQAGVAGTIASLWSVYEISTALLMIRFYDLWRKEGIQPSEALRLAQQWLRDTTNDEKFTFLETFLLNASVDQMLVKAANSLYRKFILSDPAGRDFAHPFHWAAFGYTGV